MVLSADLIDVIAEMLLCKLYGGLLKIFSRDKYTLMLGCLDPNLGTIWTNPDVGLKM